ncbi:MAG: ATP-dependent Clp protease proteolytic subunit [Campylobacter concisus]|nr:ATP-dependent Clp protease proteolytic subunit [Campylobacter concisus]
MLTIPTTIKSTPLGDRAFDLYSRLLDDNIIMLDGEVTDESASLCVAQLLYLSAKDDAKDINMYINSPGGSVSAGLAIIDTMNLIPNDVNTIATGLAASMGAMILLSGTKGKRNALPHAEVMIHQPLGGAQGQATDIAIRANHILRTRETLYSMMSDATGKDIDEIAEACERDKFLTAEEARDFGLIDHIIGC